jgi:mono/diheme cytochrome c family protein
MSLARPAQRLRPAASMALAGLVAAGLCGCGGGSAPRGGTSGSRRAGVAISGRVVFDQHCQVCHSISGSSTPEQQGGDLRGLHLPRRELVQFTVEMPVVRSRLTTAEVRAVVDYMQALARRR